MDQAINHPQPLPNGRSCSLIFTKDSNPQVIWQFVHKKQTVEVSEIINENNTKNPRTGKRQQRLMITSLTHQILRGTTTTSVSSYYDGYTLQGFTLMCWRPAKNMVFS
ncbi:MAG: hypothetical protein KDA78_01910 [Planctomycetaceae bacterium]|nr:hypothetical protein [Planctomycetaceae bacterium]